LPSNLKKLVEARRAKTGESYQTALRHVRRQQPPGRFEALVHRIIQLASERSEEYDALHPNQGAVSVGDVVMRILREPTPPREQALRDALLATSEDDLRKLEVLYYAGEPFNGTSILEMERLVPRDSHEITAHHLSKKMGMPEMLEAGLTKAIGEGVDLEAPFPKCSPRWA
jgi:hypothetical protein